VAKLEGFARNGLRLRDHRLDMEAQAGLQDAIQLPSLFRDNGIRRQRGNARPKDKQGGTLAAGSCGLKPAIASPDSRPISAPPGNRPQVVSRRRECPGSWVRRP